MPDIPEPPKALTFDAAVCEKLRQAFLDIFLHHPEVKCLSTSITWHGGLNDANIMHGIWLNHDGGPVVTADGLITSATQTLKVLDEQLQRAESFVTHLRDRVQVLGTEAVKLYEAKQKQSESTGQRNPTTVPDAQ